MNLFTDVGTKILRGDQRLRRLSRRSSSFEEMQANTLRSIRPRHRKLLMYPEEDRRLKCRRLHFLPVVSAYIVIVAAPSHTHPDNSVPDVHDHSTQPATQEVHAHQHHLYPVVEPPSARSSVFTHTTSSEESFSFVHQLGYESPLPHDHQAIERKHEMRYRMHLLHDYHPSCEEYLHLCVS